jgi:hypothetical protein
MIKCDYFKKSINNCKCKLSNSTITLLDCKLCTKFKQTSVSSINITPRSKSVLKRIKTPLNKISKKQLKSEKERYSIFTKDLDHCYLCKLYSNKEVPRDDLHEIFNGARRQTSKKYGLVLPLCRHCHEDLELINNWKLIGQKETMKYYNWNKQDFIDIFKISFLDK